MQPWDTIRFEADVVASVHVGVFWAWQRNVRLYGDELALGEGWIGSGDAVEMVAVLGRLRDRIERSHEVAWVASGSTNVVLGEWSHGAVDASESGLFIHGEPVVSWNGRVTQLGRGRTDTPDALLHFLPRAEVMPVSQDHAWRQHLVAVSRVLAQAPLVGRVTVECVAQG